MTSTSSRPSVTPANNEGCPSADAGPPQGSLSPSPNAGSVQGSPSPAARSVQGSPSPSPESASGAKPLHELVHPSWAAALAPVERTVSELGAFLRAEVAAGRGYLPAGPHVLRAFSQPLDAVRVLIVGQDPYPTPGHPVGLSFSVAPDVQPIPRSLVNIYTELSSDLGVATPSTGDLSPWADRGVLLLNRVLTVQPGASASHRGKGWESVTACAITALVNRGGPLVAILWGRDARNLAPHLGGMPYIESAHPSPLSARSGFFGSRPFSRANAALQQQGAEPIDWSLP